VAELLDTFAAEASAMIGGLDEAIGEKSAETVWRVAHTLKSNAATFGAMALSDACRALEALAKNGALDGAGVLILPGAFSAFDLTRTAALLVSAG
jgi:HPt (histidine-containing phosphotransfer) domain-containing protein